MDAGIFKRMDEQSETYWWYRGREAFVEALLKRISVARDGAAERLALDVGCGTGAMFAFLQRWGRVVGMEPSGDALVFARRRPNAGLVQAAAEHPPFGARRFSMITAFDCLEHIADDVQALGEMKRMLENGGILIMSVPAFGFLWSRRDRQLGHVRRYSAGSLRRALQAAGFHVEHVGYGYLCLFPLLILKALWDRLTPEPKRYPSDIKSLPEPWNGLLAGWLRLEARFFTRLRLPFGATVFAAARKREPEPSQ